MDQIQHLTAGFVGFVDTVIHEAESLLEKGEVVLSDVEKLVASMKTAKSLGLGTVAQFGVGSVKNADGSDWQVGQPLPIRPPSSNVTDEAAPAISSQEAPVAPAQQFTPVEEAIPIDANGQPIQ